MANRGRRGGAAAIYSSRMTEEITLSEDEREELGGDPQAPDDVEPVIDDDEPEEDQLPDYSHEGEPEPEPEGEPESAPDAVELLKRQVDELTGKNQHLENRALLSELEGNQAVVASALNAARAAADAAEAAYADAAKAGDWAKAAKAQREIAAAVADLREFEDAEAELKGRIEQAKRGPAKPAQRQAAADPFEQAISTMSAPAQDWCRRNKADLGNAQRAARAQAGHMLAVSEGIKPDSPEYFAFLDKHMGYGRVSDDNGGGRRQEPAAKKPTGKPRVAAPSGGRTAASGGPREVVLSKAEVQAARSMGMSTKDYAKHKAEIIENGKDPSRPGLRYSNQAHHTRR